MYNVNECKVRTGCKNEEWFEVETGVRQGSVLSPLLFITYLDRVIRLVKEEIPDLDGDIMVYADDLACWSEDERMLIRLVESFARNLREAGLEMNVEKTKIMNVSRGEEDVIEIIVDGQRIQNVEQFEYLGGIFARGGGSVQEIEERMKKYGRTVRALYPIMKDRIIDLEVKKIVFNSILIPTLTYGSETWSVTTNEERRIEVAEMKVLRSMLGKTRRDRVRNDWIRERVGVTPVLIRVDSARLRWWGHMERMPDVRIASRRWRWRVDGVRPRGRPKKRWMECVEDSLRRHRLPTAQELMENGILHERPVWRNMTASLTGRRPN